MEPGFKTGAWALVFSVFLSLAASAGPFEDGAKAYQKGKYQKALSLWQPLAAKGNADAMFGLGLVYEIGRGVKQDFVQAYKWYSLSAKAGNKSRAPNSG